MVCLRTFLMCRSGVMYTVVDVAACNAHVRIRICLYGLVVTLCSYALWVLFGVIILFIIDMVCMACMLVVVSLYVICYLFIYVYNILVVELFHSLYHVIIIYLYFTY